MKGKLFRCFFLVVFFAVVFLPEGWAQAAGSVTNMRYWTAPDHTRIVFDLTEPPVFTTSRQDGSLSVTFQETACAETVSRETKIGKSGIRKVSIIALKEGDVLVRLELENDVEANVFPLKKFLDKPDRLVVDIELPEVSRRESRMREQIKVSKKKKIIIIDPGHGGDDPGAIGKHRTYEKDVVLAISRRLKKTLDRHGFFQAFLTRNGDYYVPFNKRLQIAREYGADLFISIHADAARNREARGSSVYCLSLGEASSVAAKMLAQDENLADIVGGAREADMTEDTNHILINMCQTNTINVSKAFGMSVLWELSNIGELKFERVQEAPFRVLKMPEIPAVLIETAYISNPEEEKLLRSPAFQNKVAGRIARAAVQFFLSESPGEVPGVLVQGDKPKDSAAPLENKPKPFFLYTVEKGDTLSKISRRFNMTLAGLLTINQLEADAPLYVGKRLKIEGERKDQNGVSTKEGGACEATNRPGARASETAGAEKKMKKPVFFHTVAKGDTLSRIAKRFDMTLGDLVALNRLKPEDPLYVGKRLKIEGLSPDGEIKPKQAKVGDKEKGQDKRTYRVKSGDTLLTIARRQGVSVGTLLKLNDMKLDDPLYKDRILILGEQSGNP